MKEADDESLSWGKHEEKDEWSDSGIRRDVPTTSCGIASMHENNSVLFLELAAHETLVVLSEVGKMLASGDWRMPVKKGKARYSYIYIYYTNI